MSPPRILLVEDSPTDIELTREVIRHDLDVVTDGESALRFLRREGEFAGALRPDLVLLDLNLPRLSGLEVLRSIKVDPALLEIPVVVLTTSADEADVLGAYRAHAASFVTKPVDLHRFTELAAEIEDYWMGLVRLPGRGD